MRPIQVEDAAHLLELEFVEMPGLKLTFGQVQRLCNLSEEVCEEALRLLTCSGFLVQTRDGGYRRPHPERSALTPPTSLMSAM